MRHHNHRLKLPPDDGTDLFPRDASFYWRQPAPARTMNGR
ncbi:MAG: AbfB domain-containing protein [Acidobacteriota bacterium]|nr:AbfB domain-containing protein [Acidobacteriota bacterium]